MSRKRLSKDDKRSAIVSLFHEIIEPMCLPEVEELASKRGVVRNTIKDIVTELESEGEILSDKFGLSTLYWSFPSASSKIKTARLETIKQQIGIAQRKVDSNIKGKDEALEGREDSEERKQKLATLASLREENKELLNRIQQNSGNDPSVLASKLKEIKNTIDSANIWTDNVLNLRDYSISKYNINGSDFDKQFGIGEEFDTIEYPPSLNIEM